MLMKLMKILLIGLQIRRGVKFLSVVAQPRILQLFHIRQIPKTLQIKRQQEPLRGDIGIGRALLRASWRSEERRVGKEC